MLRNKKRQKHQCSCLCDYRFTMGSFSKGGSPFYSSSAIFPIPAILINSPVYAASAVFTGSSFRNVTGIGKLSSINARTPPSLISHITNHFSDSFLFYLSVVSSQWSTATGFKREIPAPCYYFNRIIVQFNLSNNLHIITQI